MKKRNLLIAVLVAACVYGAERFIYNFTFFDFFGDAPDHARDKCFVAVKPLLK